MIKFYCIYNIFVFLSTNIVFSWFMAQFWRGFVNEKPLIQRRFRRLPRRNDGAKITFSRLSKKILPLHRQTIGYASVFYIFDFSIFLPPCGVFHLLRQRTRPRNRPILLWLTLLQLRLVHLVERGPDECEISLVVALHVLCE